MFGLTFFSRLPPPTEKIRIASLRVGPAHLEPFGKHRLPAFVVGARRELGDIVGRRVGLDAAQLAEVVDGMAAVARAAADAKDEQPTVALAQGDELVAQRLDVARATSRFAVSQTSSRKVAAWVMDGFS